MALPKKWYESKTIIFNIGYTIAEICLVLLDIVPAEYAPILMGIQGITSVVLRVWFTTTAIEAKLK